MSQPDQFRPLAHKTLPPEGCFVMNSFTPKRVSATSPAIDVMTDLSKVPLATIRPDVNIQDAHQALISRGVRMLIVTDERQRILGLITANDILSEKPVMAAQKSGVKRSSLLVSDVMTAEQELETLHLRDIEKAQVGDIVATLKEVARAHALVVNDGPDGSQRLVGVFSATQIARQMGVQIQTHEMARTFAEIEALIAGV